MREEYITNMDAIVRRHAKRPRGCETEAASAFLALADSGQIYSFNIVTAN